MRQLSAPAGRDVDGYKAVEGGGRDRGTDMDAAFEAIIEEGTTCNAGGNAGL